MKITRGRKRQNHTPSKAYPKRRRRTSDEHDDQLQYSSDEDSSDEESVEPKESTHVVDDMEDNDAEVVYIGDSENVEQTKKNDVKELLRRMKGSLRENWYDHNKFVWTDDDARMFLTDAINRTLINPPTKVKMSEELFIQQNQNKMFTAMAQLRKNSQTLAYLKYAGE